MKIAVIGQSMFGAETYSILFAAILGKQNEDCCYWSVNVWC